MRRPSRPFFNKRYIGTIHSMEVHDLDNEQRKCKIDELKPFQVNTFAPDALTTANDLKFNNCAHCIGHLYR